MSEENGPDMKTTTTVLEQDISTETLNDNINKITEIKKALKNDSPTPTLNGSNDVEDNKGQAIDVAGSHDEEENENLGLESMDVAENVEEEGHNNEESNQENGAVEKHTELEDEVTMDVDEKQNNDIDDDDKEIDSEKIEEDAPVKDDEKTTETEEKTSVKDDDELTETNAADRIINKTINDNETEDTSQDVEKVVNDLLMEVSEKPLHETPVNGSNVVPNVLKAEKIAADDNRVDSARVSPVLQLDDDDDDVKIIEDDEAKPRPTSTELFNEIKKTVKVQAKKIVCEKKVFSFGYAPMLVLQKFQDHCKRYATLTAAIHSLLARDTLLRMKYRFIHTTSKYQLMVCATTLDKDYNLKPAIESLRIYTRNNQFRTIAHAIEELLLSPTTNPTIPSYSSPNPATQPTHQSTTVPIFDAAEDDEPSEYNEINKNEQKALEKIADAVYQTLLRNPKFKPKKSRSRMRTSGVKKTTHSPSKATQKSPNNKTNASPSGFGNRMLLFPKLKEKNNLQSDIICLKELQSSINDLKDRVLKAHKTPPPYFPLSKKEIFLYKLSLQPC